MNIEEFRDFCLAKPGVTEETPFDENTLVLKVGGKIFAMTDMQQFDRIVLKCNPVQAVELREQFPDTVTGAYHMNKKHWNAITPNAGLPDAALKQWIDHSYYLVYNKLTRAQKLSIGIADEPMPGVIPNPETEP